MPVELLLWLLTLLLAVCCWNYYGNDYWRIMEIQANSGHTPRVHEALKPLVGVVALLMCALAALARYESMCQEEEQVMAKA